MNDLKRKNRLGLPLLVVTFFALPLGGCGPNYYDFRREGQAAVLEGAYGPARTFFLEAEEKRRRRVENLHDLGACSFMLAREKFARGHRAAAMREVDAAIAYYTRAIDEHPGHQASLEGKRIALKLKGQFDEALKHAEWAAQFVGPSAKQYVLLAEELEERGDRDAALLRYRQAVAMEPNNAEAHRRFAEFLLHNNNEPAAVHHLQRSYRLDPTNEWVMDELVKRAAVPPLVTDGTGAP